MYSAQFYISANEPTGNDCVRVIQTGEWRDMDCTVKYKSICEKIG